jgi:hypothetical protein
VTALGGLLLLSSGNRATAMLGGWLAVLAGAWFIVGRALAGPLGLGDVGAPIAVTDAKRVSLELAYFSGLGALIVFLGAMALGRLTIRSVRDVEYVQRPVTATQQVPVAATAPAVADAPTAEVPAATTEVPAARKHRWWDGMFRGRHTHAH